MSAICGIISESGDGHLDRIVSRMCRIQAHRGPHGEGVQSFPGASLGLRLFRLDPRSSSEPASIDGGAAAIAFDGILFNRDEIVRGLPDASPGDGDDTLVLRSYRTWGRDCASRLDGIFAFAVWDVRRRTLYAARDRLGEKPFFFSINGDDLVFASEIKAVLASGRIKKELDYEVIYQFLHEKGFPPDRTPLRGLKPLSPGHWLAWRDRRLTIGEYWDVPYKPDKIDDEAYAVETSRKLLIEAVRKRCIGDEPPAVLFSGGIDSSLLLGVVDSVTDGGVKTITVLPGIHEHHLAMARRLAKRYGTDHHEIRFDGRDIATDLNDFIWYCSTPTVGSLLAYFCVKEASRLGATIAFSGHMADSIFQAARLASRFMPVEQLLTPMKLLPEPVRVGIYAAVERMLRPTRSLKLRGPFALPQLLYLYARRKRGISKWYDSILMPEQISKLFDGDIPQEGWASPADIYRKLFAACPSDSMDERNVYSVLKAGAGPNALFNYEAVAAAHAVQMQNPFLDRQLVEFARGLDFKLKGKDGSGKYIVKQLCRQIVSDEAADQKKAAFTPPFADWLRRDLWQIVEETTSRETIEKRGIFRHDKLTRLKGRFFEQQGGVGWADIWAFVVLEVWMRTHLDPAPAELSKPSMQGTAPAETERR